MKTKNRLFLAVQIIGSLSLMLASAAANPFELFVTQSPPGPQNQDPATWSGVLHYHLNSDGAPMQPAAGIDRTNLADPAGLAFRTESSELFVGNRHGNNNPSSISRFVYDSITRQLIPNGTITGNGLYGVHQIAFNPVTGEMFAANVSSGVSRFTFDASGNAVGNGTISDGAARGVAVAPDGLRLYVTGASSTIRQFDLTTGTELATVIVPASNAGLHYFEFRDGELYVAALYADTVYRYAIGANDDLTLLGAITGLNDPASAAFSPDGLEMFIAGHRTSDLIYRYDFNPQDESWTETATYDALSSLGSILTIPGGGLEITRGVENTVVVSWPAPATGWVLERTNILSVAASTSWPQVAPPYQTNTGTIFVTLTNAPSTGNQFFRLHKP